MSHIVQHRFVMKLLIGLSLLLPFRFLIFNDSFIDPLRPVAEMIHHHVFHFFFQWPSDWNWFYAAITIGHDDGLLKRHSMKAFVALGLYHLIVVSGAHLKFVDSFTKKVGRVFRMTPSPWLLFLILFLFTAVNRWEPACLRALTQWTLQHFCYTPRHSLFPILSSTLICLILAPELNESISLQLSMAASLGMAAGEILTKQKFLKSLASTSLILFLTFPFLLTFAPCLRWVAIPSNMIVKPLLETILFPFALAMTAAGPWRAWFDRILHTVFYPLDGFAAWPMPALCIAERKSTPWGIFYLLLFSGVLLILLPRFTRRRIHKQPSTFST